MKIEIKEKEAIKTETSIDLTIEADGIPYRFRITLYENYRMAAVTDISFRDKYEVTIEPKVRKAIEKHIRDTFNVDTQ